VKLNVFRDLRQAFVAALAAAPVGNALKVAAAAAE
jgi:hypothetical protein